MGLESMFLGHDPTFVQQNLSNLDAGKDTE